MWIVANDERIYSALPRVGDHCEEVCDRVPAQAFRRGNVVACFAGYDTGDRSSTHLDRNRLDLLLHAEALLLKIEPVVRECGRFPLLPFDRLVVAGIRIRRCACRAS